MKAWDHLLHCGDVCKGDINTNIYVERTYLYESLVIGHGNYEAVK